MNDHFLRSMIRQRYAQILTEVKAAQLSRLDRPPVKSKFEMMISRFVSFLRQWTRSMVHRRPALNERKRI